LRPRPAAIITPDDGGPGSGVRRPRSEVRGPDEPEGFSFRPARKSRDVRRETGEETALRAEGWQLGATRRAVTGCTAAKVTRLIKSTFALSEPRERRASIGAAEQQNSREQEDRQRAPLSYNGHVSSVSLSRQRRSCSLVSRQDPESRTPAIPRQNGHHMTTAAQIHRAERSSPSLVLEFPLGPRYCVRRQCGQP
jgi:hypothetical protein